MIQVMKVINKLSIQQKVVISLMLLIILPMLASGAFSYASSSRVINRKTTEHFYQSLSQASENYRTIFNEVENISYMILADENVRYLLKSSSVDTGYIQSYNQVNLLVRNLLAKPYVFGVTISRGGNIVYQTGVTVARVEENQWFQKAEQAMGKVVWSSLYPLDHMVNQPQQKVISLYRRIIDIDTNVPIGMIRISISEETLFEIQKSLQTGGNSKFFLIDSNGLILSHREKAKLIQLFEHRDILQNLSDEVPFYNGRVNKSQFAYIHKVKGYNYYLVGMLPSSEIFYETGLIQNLILYTLLGCLLFGLCFAYIMYRSITRPIKELISKMNEVESGNFNVEVSTRSTDEIGGLFRHFNSMVVQIKRLIKDLYEEQLKEREAELKALQEQINPHFLYNTLDTIRWTARKNQDFEVSEYIEILSSILRHNLNNGRWETDIGREIAHLKDYIYLQEKRYGDKLKVEIKVDPELYAYKIVKLVLQPIVENSIVYGVDAKPGPSSILVEGARSGNHIILRVTDNGVGTDGERINEIIQSKVETKKISALRNINDRIKLHFGEGYGIDFISNINLGTSVIITIPAIRENGLPDERI